MVSVVDIIQRFVYGFRRWFVLWFPSSQETFFMVSVVGCFMVSVVAGQLVFMVSVARCSMDSAVAGGFNVLECIE